MAGVACMKDPYQVVKHLYVTEKSMMLQSLHRQENNKCVRRCDRPKYVFVVDPAANKVDIARAVELIYKDKGVKVLSVNTLNRKGKMRRVRGRLGKTAALKRAIVTLRPQDSLDVDGGQA